MTVRTFNDAAVARTGATSRNESGGAARERPGAAGARGGGGEAPASTDVVSLSPAAVRAATEREPGAEGGSAGGAGDGAGARAGVAAAGAGHEVPADAGGALDLLSALRTAARQAPGALADAHAAVAPARLLALLQQR